MKTRLERTTPAALAAGLAVALACLTTGAARADDGAQADANAQLQRHFALRSRLDRDRQNRDNEARAYGGVTNGATIAAGDSPTVSGMRATTQQTLIQQGDMLKCNDIDVDNGEGNVVVVCGSQTGDVTSRRTVTGGDLVNVIGGAP
jgi:hypothetical protein